MSRTIVSAIALLVASQASASDLGSPYSAPLSGVTASIPHGFYISTGIGMTYSNLNVGYANSDVSGAADLSAKGFTGDLRVGYDWVLNHKFVIGPWAQVSYDQASGSAGVGRVGASWSSDYGYGVGVRAGWLASSGTLVYALGGLESQQFTVTPTIGAVQPSAMLAGAVLGGGVETQIGARMTLGIEADWISYQGWTPAKDWTVNADEIRATARVGYHF